MIKYKLYDREKDFSKDYCEKVSRYQIYPLSKLGLSLLEFSSMFNLILIVYLILGVGIGVVGSTLSMRKYLKV